MIRAIAKKSREADCCGVLGNVLLTYFGEWQVGLNPEFAGERHLRVSFWPKIHTLV